MSTIEILNGLQDYLALLSIVKDHITREYSIKARLSETVSIAYKFIELELKTQSGEIYLKCIFEIQSTKASITELYFTDRTKEDELKKFITHHIPVTIFPATTNFNNYDPAALKYFTIADEIAKEAVSCSSGDNYSPDIF